MDIILVKSRAHETQNISTVAYMCIIQDLRFSLNAGKKKSVYTIPYLNEYLNIYNIKKVKLSHNK